MLAKLAERVAPPSVRQHLAEQEAERERREQAGGKRKRRSSRGSAYDESDDPDVMDDVGAHDLLELAAAADQDPVEAQLRSVRVSV